MSVRCIYVVYVFCSIQSTLGQQLTGLQVFGQVVQAVTVYSRSSRTASCLSPVCLPARLAVPVPAGGRAGTQARGRHNFVS